MQHRRCNRLVALTLFTAFSVAPAMALTPTPTPTPTATSCPVGCNGPLGGISVSGPTVEPPNPVVGDEVVFTFPVSYSLPFGFSCGCTFVAQGDYLEGGSTEYNGNAVIVRRGVVRAGVTTVQLNVSETSEVECFEEDEFGCRSYYGFATISASSAPFEVVLSEAHSGGGGDGCAIVRGSNAGPMELFLGLLLLAAAWGRHRTSRRPTVATYDSLASAREN